VTTSPTKACLLASPADDLFVLPAAPTLPLPALPIKPANNNTTTNIPPWAELPDGWGGGNHTKEPASPGLTPAEPTEAAPTTNAATGALRCRGWLRWPRQACMRSLHAPHSMACTQSCHTPDNTPAAAAAAALAPTACRLLQRVVLATPPTL
jgi:hypothetical protein